MSKVLDTDTDGECSLLGNSDRFYNQDQEFVDSNDSDVMKELDDLSSIETIRNHRTDTDRVIEGRFFRYSILKKVLGVGAYSIVYGGVVESEIDTNLPSHIQIESGQDIAIKKIDITKMSNDDLQFVKNEENICRSIIHHQCENIVQIYDVIRTNSNVYIVMEVLTGSTFTSVLIKPMKEAYVRFYLSQIINSLIYLRNQNIVHGDVKPGNILMTHDHKTLKLCDFGFSTTLIIDSELDSNDDQYIMEIMDDDDDNNNNNDDGNENDNRSKRRIIICGSPIYMAPEIRKLDYSPNYKIDIWALGMVLHEMIFGFHPFRGIKDTRSVTKAIPNLEITRSSYIATKNRGITLLRSMLDRSGRASCRERVFRAV